MWIVYRLHLQKSKLLLLSSLSTWCRSLLSWSDGCVLPFSRAYIFVVVIVVFFVRPYNPNSSVVVRFSKVLLRLTPLFKRTSKNETGRVTWTITKRVSWQIAIRMVCENAVFVNSYENSHTSLHFEYGNKKLLIQKAWYRVCSQDINYSRYFWHRFHHLKSTEKTRVLPHLVLQPTSEAQRSVEWKH